MKERNPNPSKYWDEQLVRLQLHYPTLLKEFNEFHFQRWDDRSITYSRELGRRLSETLTNPYRYAVSTFISGLQAARKRKRMREIVAANLAQAKGVATNEDGNW